MAVEDCGSIRIMVRFVPKPKPSNFSIPFKDNKFLQPAEETSTSTSIVENIKGDKKARKHRLKRISYHLQKGMNATGRTSSRIFTSRPAVVTQTRYRLRRAGRRAINSNCSQSKFYPSNKLPFPYIRSLNDTGATRKRSTIVESNARDFQQRVEHIPEPTWSLQDLELTSNHTAITQQELKRLARLVLVDVSENHDNCDVESLNLIKQDLGNMLHMIRHVTKYEYQKPIRNDEGDSSANDFNDKYDPTANALIYDTVRGLRGMPLRKGIDLDLLQTQDAEQALDILKEKLHVKMVRRGGGHKYFAIETTES